MKNLTFLVLALLLAGSTFAQKGVKIGLQFTPGVSMALNNEDFDRGADLDLQAAFGWNLGLTVGYGFNDRLSLVTGIMFNSHQANYVHTRAIMPNSSTVADPNYNAKMSRTLGYARIPLLLEIGSDPEAGGGFFFRFGPHFDFMTGGKYKDERFDTRGGGYGAYSNYDVNQGIDLMGQTALWTPSSDKSYATKTSQMGDIYNKFVFGLTLEIGGQIRLAENFKMMIMLHLETSLTNVEGIGASSFANNIYTDITSGATATQALNNAGKYLSESGYTSPEGDIFAATYPNFTNNAQKGATFRDQTFNVFGGLTIGFAYTIPVEK